MQTASEQDCMKVSFSEVALKGVGGQGGLRGASGELGTQNEERSEKQLSHFLIYFLMHPYACI